LTYLYTLEKEGYRTIQQQLRPINVTDRQEIVMYPDDVEIQQDQAQQGRGGNRAVRFYNEGVEAQQAGDLDLAAQRFKAAAELDPDLAAAHTALGGVYHVRGEYEAAAAEAEKALEIDPESALALQLRYDAYRLAGDTEKAAKAANDLRLAGGATEAASRIYNEGVEAYRAGDTQTAMAKFQQAIGLDPDLTSAYVVLGGLYISQGKPEQANTMASEALARDPGNVNALKIRYDAARTLGDEEAADAALEALVEADPQWASTGLYDHALELYNNGEMEDAADALAQVVELNPDHARANYLLGMAEYNLGKVDKAKGHLNKFLELAPDDPEADIAREVLKYAQ
jgi:tetratricopeptide (TPR) repeat protein